MIADSELVAWVRSLPDSAEIHWYEDGMSEERPYRTGWVDVQVEALEPFGFNWVWTLVHADDGDPEDIVWPTDIETPDGPGWSVAAVNAAIVDWCQQFAGRRVVPVWEGSHGPSPIMAKALATKARIQAGVEDGYLIAPGVKASEQVMDWLIEGEFDDG